MLIGGGGNGKKADVEETGQRCRMDKCIPCFHESWTDWPLVPGGRVDGHKVVGLGPGPGGKGRRAAGGGDVSHSAIC